MQPSVPDRGRRNTIGPQDLPYGPLPVRPRRPEAEERSGSPTLDALVDLSWLEHEPPSPQDEAFDDPEFATEDAEPEPSLGVSLTTPRPETDDDVHFGVAARALGVSRKTVERMVKRGQLERGPSGAPATVSKRSLVVTLEERRRDVGHLTRATELAERQSGAESLTEAWSVGAATELQELLRPVLEPLLEEFVAARSRVAVLESHIEMFAARAEQDRGRDELLLALAAGGWRRRRRARKDALTHFVLRDRLPPPTS